MECFCRSKPFDEEEEPVREYRKRIFREWWDRGTCLWQSNVYVTKQGQLGKIDGYRNLKWKQLKDK